MNIIESNVNILSVLGNLFNKPSQEVKYCDGCGEMILPCDDHKEICNICLQIETKGERDE